MRELKFRVWDKKDKFFIDDGALQFGADGKIYYIYAGMEYDEPVLEREDITAEVIVEQYTGLKDKNSKEIYEGDIVKRFKPHEFLKNVTETEVFRIRWGVRKAGFFAYNKTRKKHSQPAKRLNANDIYEVIGNIHENPELLEKE